MKPLALPMSRAALATAALVAASTAQADVLLQQNFANGLGSFTSAGSVTTGSYGARMTASLLGTDGSIRSAARGAAPIRAQQ